MSKVLKASEGKICREVIDRHDVMKSQVLQVIREALGESPSPTVIQQVNSGITGVFQTQTNGLIDAISRQFSGKG